MQTPGCSPVAAYVLLAASWMMRARHRWRGARRSPGRQISGRHARLTAHRGVSLVVLVHRTILHRIIGFRPGFPSTNSNAHRARLDPREAFEACDAAGEHTRRHVRPPPERAAANTAMRPDAAATPLSFDCGKIADDRLPVGASHLGFPARGRRRQRRPARPLHHHHAAVLQRA